MKKAWLGTAIIVLAGAAVLGGCGSPRPERRFVASDPSTRPPETGTNIPRRIWEEPVEANPKRPAKRKPTRAKAKPKPTPAPTEEILTRGGFR